VKYSSFNNITLSLPGEGFGYVSLEALLQMFISQVTVQPTGTYILVVAPPSRYWIRSKPGVGSDPYSFDTDTDPVRIQGSDDQKLTKNYSKKINFFKIKNYNLSIPRPPERTSQLKKKFSALKRKHPALQNMKFLNFFLLLWVIFALLDTDPDSGFRSSDLIESDPIRILIRNTGYR
jgi:hypothetical protein